ncbi:copper chaperone PCu(A)C [Streptomyces zingiberis]|uniref:Copper chaperone PCu(A)C n=1 Tax=Streptomyces zingiberis TaxID=2053010 RepID=A0ABX1BSK2_9ACTN|nr:copper chaperone PCu(A)C [Streptomyces zingiberis]NJP99177.1 copper chaperone PCu(A)C [Streptomyces zingiberis]
MRRRATASWAALALGAVLALSGCGSAPELTARDGYVPQPVMADMAGGFLTVVNTGDTADRLTRVTSDISDDVELHRTQDGTMRQVRSLEVPAGGELVLSRGADHIMFKELRRTPVEGEKVTVTLHFAESDPLEVTLPVKATTYRPAAGR